MLIHNCFPSHAEQGFQQGTTQVLMVFKGAIIFYGERGGSRFVGGGQFFFLCCCCLRGGANFVGTHYGGAKKIMITDHK